MTYIFVDLTSKLLESFQNIRPDPEEEIMIIDEFIK